MKFAFLSSSFRRYAEYVKFSPREERMLRMIVMYKGGSPVPVTPNLRRTREGMIKVGRGKERERRGGGKRAYMESMDLESRSFSDR